MKPKPLKLSGMRGWIKKDLVVKTCDVDRAIDLTLHKTKERIKSACEFYLKYKNRFELFYVDLENGFISLSEGKENDFEKLLAEWRKDELSYDDYNEWLFKLAFKDVLDGGDKK